MLAASLGAHARDGSWKVTDKTDEVAATPFGLKQLLNDYRYRSLFSDLKERAVTNLMVDEDPGKLAEITVTTVSLEWQGESNCPANDPRLKTQTHEYMVCWANNTCEAASNAILNEDPCD